MFTIIKKNMTGGYLDMTEKYSTKNRYDLVGNKWKYNPGKYLIIQLKMFDNNLNKKTHNITLADTNGYMNWYDDFITPIHKKYELVGIVAHRGSFNEGHYIAYIKHNTGWYTYNDDIRTQHISYDEMRKFYKSFIPYLILYREVSDKLFDTFNPNTIPKNLVDYLIDV